MDHYPQEKWPRADLTLQKEGTTREEYVVIGYSIVPPGAPEGWIMLQLPSGGIEFKKLSNYDSVVLSPKVQAIIENNARREQQQRPPNPPGFPGPIIAKPN